VILVALVGIGVNTGSALLFILARKSNLNPKGAFLHLAADAAVSVAMVLAGRAILPTGWHWFDPAVAASVSLMIAVAAAGLFRGALQLSIDGVPVETDRTAVAEWLGRQDGVRSLNELAHLTTVNQPRRADGASCLGRARPGHVDDSGG